MPQVYPGGHKFPTLPNMTIGVCHQTKDSTRMSARVAASKSAAVAFEMTAAPM
jgi:hypothetical protein